jgi:hypothetical protein
MKIKEKGIETKQKELEWKEKERTYELTINKK